MLNLKPVILNLAKMFNRNVYYRTAQKAHKDLYCTAWNILELLGVSKNADAK